MVEVWDVPQTEEGMQSLLRSLQECREEGNLIEVGNGLLALSHLVKWVRSDTAAPPFVRSQELALEALATFRRAMHLEGEVRALIAASALASPSEKEEFLQRAEDLSKELGNNDLIASALSARARALALVDRNAAADLYRQVLEMYRAAGNLPGQARTLFGLAICDNPPEENCDLAIEAARIYRSLGDFGQASKCVTIALMNAEELQPVTELEDLIREGLSDAQASGSRTSEEHYYRKLAMIALAKGEAEEAEKYRRWADELLEADGLTPHERWKNNVEMTKMMIGTAKTQGNAGMVKAFEEELKRLKSTKPRRSLFQRER